MYAEIAAYVYPGRKAVELSSAGGNELVFQVEDCQDRPK